jgi:hypothetical protein
MSPKTENLILEILKRVQADISVLKTDLHDLKEGQISIRNQLHTMQGDTLRQEHTMARLGHRLERVENRLDLVDEPAT